jgi:hypothetical protein
MDFRFPEIKNMGALFVARATKAVFCFIAGKSNQKTKNNVKSLDFPA